LRTDWQSEGQGFESPQLHHLFLNPFPFPATNQNPVFANFLLKCNKNRVKSELDLITNIPIELSAEATKIVACGYPKLNLQTGKV